MIENKTSEAQKKATQTWRKKNPEAAKYNSYKTSARTFARHWATKEDMEELLQIFDNENSNAINKDLSK